MYNNNNYYHIYIAYSVSMIQVSIVSAHLRSIRAVVKSQQRDLTVDGFVIVINYYN